VLIGTHSFYATKNLPVGEGGMVITSEDTIAAKVRRLINHGRTVGYEHIEIGTNYRLTNIAAALGKSRLERLELQNARRREIAAVYNQEIRNERIQLPHAPKLAHHVYHQYTVRCSDRNRLKEHLSSKRVGSVVVYPKTSYQQLAFSKVPYVNMGCPNAERACKTVFPLPVHPNLTDQEVRLIVEACNSYGESRV
jgi:perosamine synthetase